jgi:vancomycin permeability regulator SanA
MNQHTDNNHGTNIIRKALRNTFVVIFVCFLLFILSLYAAHGVVSRYHKFSLSTVEQVEEKLTAQPRTVVVLGSGVNPEGLPRPILLNRLDAAVELYQAGVADQIIVSGYNPPGSYNEPTAMRLYLINKGVSENQIIKDENGDNTLATCKEAKETFNLTQLILITQGSHLDRAIYLCRSQGLDAYGYIAQDTQTPIWRSYQSFRETFSNVKAILNTKFPENELFH